MAKKRMQDDLILADVPTLALLAAKYVETEETIQRLQGAGIPQEHYEWTLKAFERLRMKLWRRLVHRGWNGFPWEISEWLRRQREDGYFL